MQKAEVPVSVSEEYVASRVAEADESQSTAARSQD